jgi:hypothetical protein
MKKLIKELDFTSKEELFNYFIDSWYNGNYSQCRNLFSRLNKSGKKELLQYIAGCFDNENEKKVYQFYFNLL